ncbi:DUF7009 family protein [uncultured Hymenobacter sp.]|uniref:DUF7009 family protein n=1 Tax=uncultured Hymenobacter sp. TaxID=170016 RepID=UPI0035CB1C98
MKLRLEDNTLRLRLSGPEVETFAATGRIATDTRLGPGPGQLLSYALERTAPKIPTPPAGPEAIEADTAGLRYAPGQITVLVPAPLADKWTSTSQTGFSAEIIVSETAKLRILVEKDLDWHH